jgi:hypothetical protein
MLELSSDWESSTTARRYGAASQDAALVIDLILENPRNPRFWAQPSSASTRAGLCGLCAGTCAEANRNGPWGIHWLFAVLFGWGFASFLFRNQRLILIALGFLKLGQSAAGIRAGRRKQGSTRCRVLFLCLPGSRQVTGQTLHTGAGAVV